MRLKKCVCVTAVVICLFSGFVIYSDNESWSRLQSVLNMNVGTMFEGNDQAARHSTDDRHLHAVLRRNKQASVQKEGRTDQHLFRPLEPGTMAADGDQSRRARPEKAADGGQSRRARPEKAADGDQSRRARPEKAADGGQSRRARPEKAADGDQSRRARPEKAADGGQSRRARPEKAADSPPRPWEPDDVYLFSYARSGSSLLGDIIAHSRDVYYVFEPLRKLYLTRNPLRDRSLRPAAGRIMRDLFACNFTTHFLHNVDVRFLEKTSKTRALQRCFKFPQGGLLFKDCVQRAKAICRQSRKTVAKALRYPLTLIKQMLTLNPDMALLYLVRDPRGVIWSRITWFPSNIPKEFEDSIQDVCDRMTRDARLIQQLYREEPNRIRFVRYEDLAKTPVQVSQNIYDYIRLDMTSRIQREIQGQTHPDSNNSKRKHAFSDPYSVTRADSYAAANQWRTVIPPEVTVTIEKHCLSVMEMWGYFRFSSVSELRNLTLPNRNNSSNFLQLPNSTENGDLGVVKIGR